MTSGHHSEYMLDLYVGNVKNPGYSDSFDFDDLINLESIFDEFRLKTGVWLSEYNDNILSRDHLKLLCHLTKKHFPEKCLTDSVLRFKKILDIALNTENDLHFIGE